MLETAIEAAKQAGEVLKAYFETTGLEREIKEDASFATKADKEAEEVIVRLIQERFPEHGIVGEEGAHINPEAEYQWIIDPLDGTSNFLNGIPLFAVSIAVVHENASIVGVVYNPITDSMYAAERGKGTTYNGKPVRVSDQSADAGTVSLGPSKPNKLRGRAIFSNSVHAFKSARFIGATALELAYIARGGMEAFVCLDLHPWDYAAGQLLVAEAGGKITDLAGNACDVRETYFIASNGVAHQALKELANSA